MQNTKDNTSAHKATADKAKKETYKPTEQITQNRADKKKTNKHKHAHINKTEKTRKGQTMKKTTRQHLTTNIKYNHR